MSIYVSPHGKSVIVSTGTVSIAGSVSVSGGAVQYTIGTDIPATGTGTLMIGRVGTTAQAVQLSVSGAVASWIVDTDGNELDLMKQADNFNAAKHGILIFGVDEGTPQKYRQLRMNSEGDIHVVLSEINTAEPSVAFGTADNGTLRVAIATNQPAMAITGTVSVGTPTVTVSTGTVTIAGTPTITGTVTGLPSGTQSVAVVSPIYVNAATAIAATGTGFLMMGVQATTSRAITLTTTGAQNIWAIGGTITNVSTAVCVGIVATDTAIANPPVTVGGRASDILPGAMSTAGDVVNAGFTLKGALKACNPYGTPNSLVKTVTTAGTEVPLAASTTIAYNIRIKAQTDNVGMIYIGGNPVTSATGRELLPGEEIHLDFADLNLIYIDCSVNGEGVSVYYET